jgi:hypothetical protein
MPLEWYQQSPQLWMGVEPTAQQTLTWRAHISSWDGPWKVTTDAGRQSGAFATAREAIAAVDDAFDRIRRRPSP